MFLVALPACPLSANACAHSIFLEAPRRTNLVISASRSYFPAGGVTDLVVSLEPLRGFAASDCAPACASATSAPLSGASGLCEDVARSLGVVLRVAILIVVTTFKLWPIARSLATGRYQRASDSPGFQPRGFFFLLSQQPKLRACYLQSRQWQSSRRSR